MRIYLLGVLLCLAGTMASYSRAEVSNDTIKATADKYSKSSVDLVFAVKYSTDEGAQTREIGVPGVIIDPSGLIATTLYAIGPPESSKTQVNSKIVSVRIRLASGTEIPGKVVLRDSDHNLAFVRPIAAATTPYSAMNFAVAGQAQLGENVVVLGNLGKIGNHATRVTIGRVVGVIDKPRTLYALEASYASPFGNAVFNEKGEVLGIGTIKTSGSTDSRMNFNIYESMLFVVVPADQVLEVASQAPQVKDVKESSEPAPTTPAPTVKPKKTH